MHRHRIPTYLAMLIITLVASFATLMLIRVTTATEDAFAAQEAAVFTPRPSDFAR